MLVSLFIVAFGLGFFLRADEAGETAARRLLGYSQIRFTQNVFRVFGLVFVGLGVALLLGWLRFRG